MNYWQDIQTSFRGSIEGAAFTFFLLVLISIGFPVLYHLFAERLQRNGKMKSLRRRLSGRGLAKDDWVWVEKAVVETCPENPVRILDSQSLFHVWVDGLDGLESQDPVLLETLERIRETIYPDSPGAIVPHSSRDLIPGVSVNIVTHTAEQEVVPGIVTEVGLDMLRVGKRGIALPSVAVGADISLFYPRPEAMYHVVCKVAEASPAEIRLAHAAKGKFSVRQLREFWRVDVDIPVEFMVVAHLGEHEAGNTQRVRSGRIINLSGSGAAILTEIAPPRGSQINFPLDVQVKTVTIQAEVLHLTQIRERSRLHLVFRNLDPGDQELIIRSLFARYRDENASKNSFSETN